MARENFQQILERKKREGNHRVLTQEDHFGGPEGSARFNADMKEVKRKSAAMHQASIIAGRDKILSGTMTSVNRY